MSSRELRTSRTTFEVVDGKMMKIIKPRLNVCGLPYKNTKM